MQMTLSLIFQMISKKKLIRWSKTYFKLFFHVYQLIDNTINEVKLNEWRGINLQRELIDKQRGELQEEIERLTEERKKVRRTRRECETEECYDKITLKVSEMKIQIKRLEKVGDELFTKWSKTFDEMSKMESIFSWWGVLNGFKWWANWRVNC